MQKITPFLWFDDNAEAAVKLYTSVFKKAKITSVSRYVESMSQAAKRPVGSVMTIGFVLEGQSFVAINGGPAFKQSPAVSFFVHCKTAAEVNARFKKLSDGGQVMMPLGKYPFNERYAFFKDKYGVSWQLLLSPKRHDIVPCLLFVGKNLGKAEAAMKHYVSIFPNANVKTISHYGKGQQPNKAGTVQHAEFEIAKQPFVVMDGAGPHQFAFNESVSFVVSCTTQKELDMYWNALSKGGQESYCGWLKDKFGVSWQITPTILATLSSGKATAKATRAMGAMLKMRKIDIATIKKAAAGK